MPSEILTWLPQLLLPSLSANNSISLLLPFHSPLTSHTDPNPQNPSTLNPSSSALLLSHSTVSTYLQCRFMDSKRLKKNLNLKPSKIQSQRCHTQTNQGGSLWETCLTHCLPLSWLSSSERLVMLSLWRFVHDSRYLVFFLKTLFSFCNLFLV